MSAVHEYRCHIYGLININLASCSCDIITKHLAQEADFLTYENNDFRLSIQYRSGRRKKKVRLNLLI
jgi:hypothetical protein